MGKKILFLLVLVFGVLIISSGTAQAKSTQSIEKKWDNSKEIVVDNGTTKFYAYLSKDKKESWIFKVEPYSDESIRLKFPKKIQSAKLTTIGAIDELYPGEDDSCRNICGGMFEPWHGEASEIGAEIVNVTMPDSVKTLSASAFAGFVDMKSITISKNLKSIPAYAFYCCDSLKSFTVGKNIRKISESAFDDCEKLKNIAVEKGNAKYQSQNGMLLNRTGDTIILAPYALKKVRIPEGVKKIGKKLFYKKKIREVWIPKSLKKIGANAFSRTRLGKWHIAKGNSAFGKTKECVYEKKTGRLVFLFSSEKKVRLPKEVTRIDNTLSVQKFGVEKLVLPKTFKVWGDGWTDEIQALFGNEELNVYFTSSSLPKIKDIVGDSVSDYFVPVISKKNKKKYQKWLAENFDDMVARHIKLR